MLFLARRVFVLPLLALSSYITEDMEFTGNVEKQISIRQQHSVTFRREN